MLLYLIHWIKKIIEIVMSDEIWLRRMINKPKNIMFL